MHTPKSGKSIGLVAAVSIGVGGMIGAGIFSILGVGVEITGNTVYFSFIIAGLIALLCAYSFAKLGATYPSAGGPVEFLIKGFGNGTLSGTFNILLWVGYTFALALYARAFGSYAVTFFSNPESGPLIYIFINGIIVLFVLINIIGVKAVGRSEIVIVAIKLAILIAFVLIAAFFVKPELVRLATQVNTSGILFAAGVLFLGYEGFGLITNAAEDMPEPGKTLPRSLYISVLLVIVVYVSISLVVVGNLDTASIVDAKDYALAAAAQPFLGKIGFSVMAIAALFSTASAINATLFGGANVSYELAKNGQLPKVFNRKGWHNSREGLFITAATVMLFANLFELGGIAMLGSAAFLIIYTSVNAAHLRIFKKTGANRYIILVSILLNLSALSILVYYLFLNSVLTLIVLMATLVLCILAELFMQKVVKRRMIGHETGQKS